MTRILPGIGLALGEGPVWDERTRRLWFVDIAAGRLFRADPESGLHESWDWGEKISCLALTESGEAVMVAGVSGIWRFRPESGGKELWRPFPDLAPGMRPNDGKAGPDGAFWVGTMEDRDDRGPAGKLYRFAPDGGVEVMAEGLVTPNGLDWSPDGTRMYLAETRALEVVQFDFDAKTGQIGNRRPFVTLAPDQGKPDGAAVDAAGIYWVCGIYAGKVWGFDPDGAPAGSVAVGAEMVTMPCFGGPALDRLYVTSLSRAGKTDAGLHALPAPAPGRPAWRFGG